VFALAVLLCLAVALTKAVASGEPVAILVEWCLSALCALLFVPLGVTGVAYLFPLNVAFWSLCQEMLVNLLYAATARRLTDRVLAVIVAGSALLLAVTAFTTGTMGHGFFTGLPSFLGGLLRAVFGIGLGLLMYRQRQRLSKLATCLPSWCSLVLVTAVLAAPQWTSHPWLVELATIFVVLPLAVLMGAAADPAPGWRTRVMLALGAASYPLYLLHNPGLKFVRRVADLAGDWSRPAMPVLAVMLVLACVQIDKRFDLPARQWLRERLQRRRAVPAASPR
jgi:peptidoglycan/LPS O-acetylase OafA/YrhL